MYSIYDLLYYVTVLTITLRRIKFVDSNLVLCVLNNSKSINPSILKNTIRYSPTGNLEFGKRFFPEVNFLEHH